jgi:hypothetical protein
MCDTDSNACGSLAQGPFALLPELPKASAERTGSDEEVPWTPVGCGWRMSSGHGSPPDDD